MRARAHGNRVTYSPKVFIPLTMLCRDRCGYCTFAKPPARVRSPYLSPDEVLTVARAGAAAGCHEALFTLGEAPEARYPAARAWLDEQGYGSTVDYLAAMCALVRDETGLLPHANAGALDDTDLARLRPVAASQGMMLESLDADLACHRGSPDKTPRATAVHLARRRCARHPLHHRRARGDRRVARRAGPCPRRHRGAQRLHGHVQEVIVQNFLPKPGRPCTTTRRALPRSCGGPSPWRRLVLPPEVHVQAPPNLSDDLRPLLDSGSTTGAGSRR